MLSLRASGSDEEPVYTRRVSKSVKVRAPRAKNYANIEEKIAEGGFGFFAKVKYKSVSY